MKYRVKLLVQLVVALVGLTVGAVGLYLGVIRPQHERELDDRLARRLLPFDKEEIRQMVFEQAGRTTRLVVSGEGANGLPLWSLTDPVAEQADSLRANSILAALELTTAVSLLDAQQSREPARFGLDHPRGRLTLVRQDGSSFELWIGARNSFGNNIYVLRPADGTIFQLEADMEGSLLVTSQTLRKRQLPRFAPEQVTRILISHRGERLQLDRRENGWRLSAPLEDNARPEAVGEVLDRLQALEAIDFPSLASPPKEADGWQIEAHAADQALVHLQVVAGEGGRWLARSRLSGEPASLASWFELPRLAAESVVVSLGFFLDRALVRFFPQEVTRIQYVQSGRLVVFEKRAAPNSAGSGEADRWSQVAPRLEAVPPEEVAEWLERLRAARALEVRPGSTRNPQTKPEPALFSLSLGLAPGTEAVRLEFTSPKGNRQMVRPMGRPVQLLFEPEELSWLTQMFQRSPAKRP